MTKRYSFEHVTQAAKSAAGLSIEDTVLFHAFNPRGLVAAQRAIDETIRSLVNTGRAYSGAHFAFGSLDDYSYNTLMGFVERKTRLSRRELNVVLSMYEARNARAKTFVKEQTALPINEAAHVGDA